MQDHSVLSPCTVWEESRVGVTMLRPRCEQAAVVWKLWGGASSLDRLCVEFTRMPWFVAPSFIPTGTLTLLVLLFTSKDLSDYMVHVANRE